MVSLDKWAIYKGGQFIKFYCVEDHVGDLKIDFCFFLSLFPESKEIQVSLPVCDRRDESVRGCGVFYSTGGLCELRHHFPCFAQ